MPSPKETWSCIMKYIEKVALGGKLCLSAQNPGCSGAACYLGFKEPRVNAGRFLTEKEKFKMCIELGNAFYAGIQAPPAKDNYLVLDSYSCLRGFPTFPFITYDPFQLKDYPRVLPEHHN